MAAQDSLGKTILNIKSVPKTNRDTLFQLFNYGIWLEEFSPEIADKYWRKLGTALLGGTVLNGDDEKNFLAAIKCLAHRFNTLARL